MGASVQEHIHNAELLRGRFHDGSIALLAPEKLVTGADVMPQPHDNASNEDTDSWCITTTSKATTIM